MENTAPPNPPPSRFSRVRRLGWGILKHGAGVDLPLRMAALTFQQSRVVAAPLQAPPGDPEPAVFERLMPAERRIMHRRCAVVFHAGLAGLLCCLGVFAQTAVHGHVLAGLGALGGWLIGWSLCFKYGLVAAQLRAGRFVTVREWGARPAGWRPPWTWREDS